MFYLRSLYLFGNSDVKHILCCVFCFVFLRLVGSFSGLFILDFPFGILKDEQHEPTKIPAMNAGVREG
jgi:hypothetical protein